MQAHEAGLPARDDIRLAIIGPDGRDAMIRRAADLAAAKIPFVFDPGQGLPMMGHVRGAGLGVQGLKERRVSGLDK